MPSVEQKFTLHVGSRTDNLALIRGFVTHVGNQAGLPETEIGKLELAVDEACANVIEHAYGNDDSKEVIVRALFDDDILRIDVIDSGRGFDPDTIRQDGLNQMVAQRRTGGLGLRLIQSLVDEVYYEVEPGAKNELRLIKKIRKTS